MADFQRFLPTLLAFEGGFVDDPVDPGGATNKGITMGTFRQYARRILGIEPTLANLKALTDAQAGRIYKPLYWDAIRGDDIALQELANIVFDFQVNAGANAAKLLQRVLNGEGVRPAITVDGRIGNATLAALRASDATKVYMAFKQGRKHYYNDLVRRSPKLQRYLKGWINRVDAFPDLPRSASKEA